MMCLWKIESISTSRASRKGPGSFGPLSDFRARHRLARYYTTLDTLAKRIDDAMKHNAKQMGTVDYADKKNDVDGLGVEGACCLKNKGRKYVTQEYETLLFYSFYSFYSSSVLPLLTPRPAHVFLGVDFYEGSLDDVDPSEWQVPPHCIPIHTNVTSYDWTGLGAACQFDVIMMDPPWQLATANPTRGVALGYSQLTDKDIEDIPIPSLQKDGFLFMWVINAKYQFALDLFEHWGYELVDEVVWVKMTVNRRLAKSHGFYLQHAKEVCLVGRRGAAPAGLQRGVGSDVIYSERRGQSQKPEDIYELIEKLVPGGKYLEIFGRKNNLRNHWVTVGNEVTGTGLPKED